MSTNLPEEAASSSESRDTMEPRLCMENAPAACADSAMQEMNCIPLSVGLFVRVAHYRKLGLIESSHAGQYLCTRSKEVYPKATILNVMTRALRLYEKWDSIKAQKDASQVFLAEKNVAVNMRSFFSRGGQVSKSASSGPSRVSMRRKRQNEPGRKAAPRPGTSMVGQGHAQK